MIIRDHLEPVDALLSCTQLGLRPDTAGNFSCWKVPDHLVDLLAEHAGRLLTVAKAQELFGDKWEERS